MDAKDTKIVKQTLRRVFCRSTAYNNIFKRSVIKQAGNRNSYRCNKCCYLYRKGSIQVNHIKPLMDAKDIYEWIKLMFDDNNLELVCNECHIVITEEQRNERKQD